MPKPHDSESNPTQPSEIPTAIQDNPFSEESHTVTEDATLELTPHDASSDESVDRFRRPTRSEIVDAVEQVNTEAVDVAELQRQSAEQSATDEEEIDEEF